MRDHRPEGTVSSKMCIRDRFRDSGEPYFEHPVAVATILAEMQLDQATFCLLYTSGERAFEVGIPKA